MSLASRNPRRRTLTFVAAGATAAALMVLPAQATLTGTASTFNAGDGNMAQVAGDPHDWADFAPTSAGGAIGTTAGAVVLQAHPMDEFKGSANADNAYSNGAKEDDNPASTGVGGVPPNKDDFTQMYIATEHATAAPNHDFLYMAWERTSSSGTAFESFEFNQASTLGTNGLPLRTKGDLLVLYDLVSGGSVPQIHVATWLDSTNDSLCDNTKDNGSATGCWAPRRDVSGTTEEASINSGLNGFSGQITDPITGATQPANTFGETGIDLQGSHIFDPGTCAHFGYGFLASRSSSAVDATMKDFVTPAQINVSNCATLSWTKVDDVGTGQPLAGAEFTVYKDLPLVGAYASGTDPILTAATTLSADITDGATSITVASAAGLPSRGTFYVTIGSEKLRVTKVVGNVLTVVRGITPTTAAPHSANAAVTWTGTCAPTAITGDTNVTCTVGNLLFGDYIVRETTTPTGYTTASDWFTSPSTTTPSTHVFTDNRAPVNLTVNKRDDAGTPVAVPVCGASGAVAGACAAFKLYNDVATPVGGAAAAGFHNPAVYYDTANATTLGAAVNNTTLTLPVADGSAFPTGAFTARIDGELIAIASRLNNTLTASTRGIGGTTAAAHALGAAVTQAVLGEDTDTGKSCVATATAGQCTFASVSPGSYWVVESTTPAGYATADPFSKTLVTGGGDQSITMTDPRLFKVVTVVCQESNNQLYPAKVAYDGGALPGVANTPTANAALATAVCGLSGTYVHGDVPKSGATHTSTISIP